MAQSLRRNLDDTPFLVVMGFESVHQDLLVRPSKDPVVAFDARVLESVGRNWPKIASYRANPHDGALFPCESRSIKGPAKPRLIRARASLGESSPAGGEGCVPRRGGRLRWYPFTSSRHWETVRSCLGPRQSADSSSRIVFRVVQGLTQLRFVDAFEGSLEAGEFG